MPRKYVKARFNVVTMKKVERELFISKTLPLAINLHLSGMTAFDVAKKIGVAAETTKRWLVKAGVYQVKCMRPTLPPVIVTAVMI